VGVAQTGKGKAEEKVVTSASGEKASEATKATYVGSKKCKMCHMPVYKAWEATKHATAIKALGDTAKAECFECHTVGYKKTGGFVSLDKTPELVNVQCENCHGPGSLHVKASKEDRKKTVTVVADASLCLNCHTKKRSPGFKFEEKKAIGVHKVATG